VAGAGTLRNLVGTFAHQQDAFLKPAPGTFFSRNTCAQMTKPKAIMRVLLRDVRTGLYFRQPHGWTAETEQAQSFKHSAEAMNLARKQRVQEAEVILSFEESSYAVALPLP
jgi:hypothetical protein